LTTQVPLGSYSARQIVGLALRDSGYVALGQQPTAMMVNESLLRLNMITASWNAKRWMSWHLQDIAYVPAAPQQYYTVGTQGNFNVGSDFNNDFNADFGPAQERPLQVERAYARLTNTSQTPTDYPLRLIPTMEDYSSIILKTQTNFPTHYFYDPAFPLGHIYFWPIPNAGTQPWEMHIIVRHFLQPVATLDTVLAVPPEYAYALTLTLAVWIRLAAKLPPDPELRNLQRDALASIRTNNTALAALKMPVQLTRRRIYNILADEWH
jgi:hypothetical protein